MNKCSCCGKCCEHSAFPNLFCNFLLRFKDGTTKCSVYSSRLGRIVFPEMHVHTKEGMLVYPEVRCGLRSVNNRYIEGCSVIDSNSKDVTPESDLKANK